MFKEVESIVTSSIEVEHQTLASYVLEIPWLHNLLHELKVPLIQKSIIYYDNIGAIYLSVNSVFHSKMKYISINFHFARDCIGHTSFSIWYILSKDHLTNTLTKPLPFPSCHTPRLISPMRVSSCEGI